MLCCPTERRGAADGQAVEHRTECITKRMETFTLALSIDIAVVL